MHILPVDTLCGTSLIHWWQPTAKSAGSILFTIYNSVTDICEHSYYNKTKVDFHEFFKMFNTKVIPDVFGKNHPVEDVDIVLTASQFKALGWFRDCKKDWNDYWKAFKKYNHALHITNVSKKIPDALTQLNYQFLATVSIQPEEFCPTDLRGGWDHSPAEDERNWLTKTTEQLYYDLRVDNNRRRAYFLESQSKTGLSKHSREYIMAAVLKKECAVPERPGLH